MASGKDIKDFPFSAEVAYSIKPVIVGCPVTKELYGHFQPVISVNMTLMEFSRAYAKKKYALGHRHPFTAPTSEEMSAAKDYFSTLTV